MTRTWPALLPLILLGCGTIFLEPTFFDSGDGPPEEPLEPGRTTDTQPEEDTEEETHETDPGDGDNAPQLSSLDLSERGSDETVQVTFEVFDLDNDLTGGLVSLTIGGAGYAFDIPADLDQYSATGTSRCHVDGSRLEVGDTVSGTMYVADAAGNRSDTLSDSFTMAGYTATVSEGGDESSDAAWLGTITLPAIIEGNLYRASNSGGSYTGDLDWTEFKLSSSQTVTFSLVWDAVGSDYDLHLLQGQNNLAGSVEEGGYQPEGFTRSLSANTTYSVVVAGWDGSPGGWTVTLE